MGQPSRPWQYTVLVMGAPGHEPRRFQVRRATLLVAVSALLALPVAAGALGYGLAASGAGVSSVGATPPPSPTSIASSAPVNAAPPAPEARARTAPARPAAPAATAVAAAEAPAAVDAPATEGAPADDHAPSDPTLTLLPASGEGATELQPFTGSGAPRASVFEQLADLMACSDGTRQAPTPALVRTLVQAQQAFDRPVMMLGGRCSAHRDREDAQRHHRTGRAVDVRLRGVSSKRLTDWLVEQGVGGVGRYGKRGFVHLDLREGDQVQWEEEAQAESAAKPRARRPSTEEASGEEEATPELAQQRAEPAEAPSEP